VVASIERSKTRGLARVLTGLGIRYVGSQNAQILAGDFGSIEAIVAADAARLMQSEGVGERIAESVAFFFAQAPNRSIVDRLRAAGVVLSAPLRERAPKGPLAGATLVLTGTLPTLTREAAAAMIVEAGGKVASAVSGKTSYVVAGADAGSKLAKAESLGVPVLDEDGLRALLG
jgi:DNA ligase (NAD+)